MKRLTHYYLLLLLVLTGCQKKGKELVYEEVLYNTYCASCHVAPKIDELPKSIWENNVLPDMASRMKIIGAYQDSNNVETYRPEIALMDWVRLKDYIVKLAPEELPISQVPHMTVQKQFKEHPISLDDENGGLITHFRILENGHMSIGNLSGELFEWDYVSKTKIAAAQKTTAITDYTKMDSARYITEVGILDPSEKSQGAVWLQVDQDTILIADGLHRPVNTLVRDLNGNGNIELVVSEFGNETGQLTLLFGNDPENYTKKTLLNLSGCIRTIAKDMNNDGQLDLITMTTQGNEGVTILYQEENLNFKAAKVIDFSPVFGNSWFELVDYNQDGFDDIITVNGDNADKSYVHKPYHGLRVHLNDGHNNFEEVFFYPLNGATRVVANDFDQDGDVDFAVISTFPDYQNNPERSFVFLENNNSSTFDFSTHILNDPNSARWFLMDANDIDSDGDHDLVLTSFTYVFTPVPEALESRWGNTNVDIMVLENTLKP